MPIIACKAPPRGVASLVASVTELLRKKAVPPGMPVNVRLEELSHSEAHPVYTVPLDRLVEGKLLDAATLSSWRYLIVHDGEAIAEAELGVKARGAGQALQFAGLTRGPFVAATIEALRAAEKFPEVGKADYELRLLRLPSVYLFALWLHGNAGDILVPMGTPPAGLKKNRPYSEAALVKALRPVAARTLRFHDSYDEKRPKARKKRR